MIPTYIFLPFVVVTGLAADIWISATYITERVLGAEALLISKLTTCVEKCSCDISSHFYKQIRGDDVQCFTDARFPSFNLETVWTPPGVSAPIYYVRHNQPSSPSWNLKHVILSVAYLPLGQISKKKFVWHSRKLENLVRLPFVWALVASEHLPPPPCWKSKYATWSSVVCRLSWAS